MEDNNTTSPLRIKTLERLSSDYALYTWPCSPLLGYYVYHKRDAIANKRIIELGSGTAIPGIIAAKCGASHVTLSDREDKPHLLQYLREACQCNNVGGVEVIGLTWGVFSPFLINKSPPYDIILASDCFYDSKDFEDVLVTVAYIMSANNSCVFWTTYQERSSNRSLLPLLDKWDLLCKVIPIEMEWFNKETVLIEGPTSSYLDIHPSTPNKWWDNNSSLQLWEIKRKDS